MSSLKWTFTLVFHEKLQQQRSFNNKMMDFVSALEGLKIPPTTNERSTSSTVIQYIRDVYSTIGTVFERWFSIARVFMFIVHES